MELELENERLKRQKAEEENRNLTLRYENESLKSALVLQSTCRSDAERWTLYKKAVAGSIWFKPSEEKLDFSHAPRELPEAVTQAYFTGNFDVKGKYAKEVKAFKDDFKGISIFKQLNENTTVRVDSHSRRYLGVGLNSDNAPDVSTIPPGYELHAGTVETVVDLKRWTSGNPFTGGNCGEMVRYGNHVLDAQPHRHEVTLGLTDCHQVMFIRCRRPDPEESILPYIADYSNPYELSDPAGIGNRLLRALLTTLFHHPELRLTAQPTILLASGSTCQIFSVKGDDNSVIKIVWSKHLVDAEVAALEKLRGVDGIVQLEEHSTAALRLSPRAECSATFMALQGRLQPNQLSPIVNSLRACHQLGVLHRDVRLDNILLHKDVYILGDFGSSGFTSKQPESYHAPTLMRFAPESENVHFKPAHDLLSLVKSVYIAAYQPMVSKLLAEDVAWVHQFWTNNLKPEPWASMVQCTSVTDYDGLFKLISEYKTVL